MVKEAPAAAPIVRDLLAASENLRRRRALAGSVARHLGRTVVRANRLKRNSVAALERHRRRVGDELKTLGNEAKAEANEFIMSPHLMFRPLTLSLSLVVPLLVPLVFMPAAVLVVYFITVILWYLTLVAIFAAEVAMRPPWYKTGLPLTGQPAYWRGVLHNPMIDLGLDFDDVEFTNADGCTLRGWFITGYVDGVASKEVVVAVHGAGRDRRAFLRHSEVLVRNGFSVLLFDFSEHGASDGSDRGFSFGVREHRDVVAAVDFVYERVAPTKVVLLGTSAGGASCILAAEKMGAERVHAVVAENPFSRPGMLYVHHLKDLLSNYLSQNTHQVGRRILFWCFARVLLLRIGSRLTDYGPLDAVKRINCPLLVMHSNADEIVPVEHSEEIFDKAVEPKEFWRVERSDHCALYDDHPAEWEDRVVSFVRKHE